VAVEEGSGGALSLSLRRLRDPSSRDGRAGVERGARPPGRVSTVRMALWWLDLEVGVASLSDLVGGGGGGSFGRHGVVGRRAVSCGGRQ
jgi:hypothetical protein